MNSGSTRAISLLGLHGTSVLVECQISNGLPSLSLVGLPDASLTESIPRVRSALHAIGQALPASRVTVNLSPADIPKSGSSFDLAIAVSLLMAMGKVPDGLAKQSFHIGELGLNGEVRPVKGVLASVAAIHSRHPTAWIVVPEANLREATLAGTNRVVAVKHLSQLKEIYSASKDLRLYSEAQINNLPPRDLGDKKAEQKPDYAQVVGQEEAVFANLVAAAGGHNLLMIGPPGSGKTMLAERFPTILPSLSLAQAIETTSIHSLRFFRDNASPLLTEPPLVAPHHSASMTALVGGGSREPNPGAISLAHNGVLFLDEATEFSTHALDGLRQPMESGRVTISRAKATVTFPARFQLILAANPCACGNLNQGGYKRCSCPPNVLSKYRSKLSGPLLDRVDLQIRVARPTVNATLGGLRGGSSSADLAERVLRARDSAAQRFAGMPWNLNSQAPSSWVREHFASCHSDLLTPLRHSILRGEISMRGFTRILRVAMTLKDLSGEKDYSREVLQIACKLRSPGFPN